MKRENRERDGRDQDPEQSRPGSPPDKGSKPFEPPKLTRHDSLPEITTGFVGSFTP